MFDKHPALKASIKGKGQPSIRISHQLDGRSRHDKSRKTGVGVFQSLSVSVHRRRGSSESMRSLLGK